MCLSSGFVRESVEDAESRWTQLNPKPGHRCRFLLHQRKPTAQKVSDYFLFSRLSFEPDPQRNLHVVRHESNSFSCEKNGERFDEVERLLPGSGESYKFDCYYH